MVLLLRGGGVLLRFKHYDVYILHPSTIILNQTHTHTIENIHTHIQHTHTYIYQNHKKSKNLVFFKIEKSHWNQSPIWKLLLKAASFTNQSVLGWSRRGHNSGSTMPGGPNLPGLGEFPMEIFFWWFFYGDFYGDWMIMVISMEISMANGDFMMKWWCNGI